ncbi:MAG: hypothetical protein F6J89_26340 [Symploca sp. SIO1C4]|uniref:Porin family protein n=1 Tax=Symploca sp. SIO1C4 TaxID=2607765 RepID=A0A6B3NKS2_9CYAN|nr:hypothetical protein [Symploca sp. SIO1C4]
MKKILAQPIYLVSLAALTIVSSPLSAPAETIRANSSTGDLKAAKAQSPVAATAETIIFFSEPLVSQPNVGQTPEEKLSSANWQPLEAQTTSSPANFEFQPLAQIGNDQKTVGTNDNVITAEPNLGNLETSAAALLVPPQESSGQANNAIAQRDFEIGRPTRGGSSYVGIGINLGLTDEGTALGDIAFVVNSKLGLTKNISFRPAAVIADNAVFLLPVTYDFAIEPVDPFEPVRIAPFVGAGIGFATDSDNSVGFVLTGGVDWPFARQFVANASVNVGFFDDTDLGIILGVGYSFPGF